MVHPWYSFPPNPGYVSPKKMSTMDYVSIFQLIFPKPSFSIGFQLIFSPKNGPDFSKSLRGDEGKLHRTGCDLLQRSISAAPHAVRHGFFFCEETTILLSGDFIEGSLEVKLPTIWTVEKQR